MSNWNAKKKLNNSNHNKLRLLINSNLCGGSTNPTDTVYVTACAIHTQTMVQKFWFRTDFFSLIYQLLYFSVVFVKFRSILFSEHFRTFRNHEKMGNLNQIKFKCFDLNTMRRSRFRWSAHGSRMDVLMWISTTTKNGTSTQNNLFLLLLN